MVPSPLPDFRERSPSDPTITFNASLRQAKRRRELRRQLCLEEEDAAAAVALEDEDSGSSSTLTAGTAAPARPLQPPRHRRVRFRTASATNLYVPSTTTEEDDVDSLEAERADAGRPPWLRHTCSKRRHDGGGGNKRHSSSSCNNWSSSGSSDR